MPWGRSQGSEDRAGETQLTPEGTLATALQAGTHGLQILNAQKEDAGQYTCVVTNEVGEAVKNYHVEVLSESGPPGTGGRQEVAREPWDPGAWAIPDTPDAFMGLSARIVTRQPGQLGHSPVWGPGHSEAEW